MRSLSFAARALVRQPGRSLLGVAGIAGVGALLFDMLLLSNGLVVSFRRLLDEVGYDVRVTATDSLIGMGPRLGRLDALVPALAALPEVAEVVPLRFGEADVTLGSRRIGFTLVGAPPVAPGKSGRAWTVIEGSDLGGAAGDPAPLLVSRRLAGQLGAAIGDTIDIRGSCTDDRSAVPPVTFRIIGIAQFPYDDLSALTAAARLDDVARTCGEHDRGEADLILIRTREGRPDATVAAIRGSIPGIHPFSNEQLVARIQEAGLSYFRQISTVLASVTLFFGFLLIAVLLTVSVNQRLGEIATLRAVGFSRRRIAADVLWQSAMLVGLGGALALPLGVALSRWLDTILRAMPGVPSTLNFFEYEPRALVLYVSLLAATAILAAAYPVHLVARLPIATTLRNEVVS